MDGLKFSLKFLAIGTLSLGLAACGSDNDDNNDGDSDDVQVSQNQPEPTNDALPDNMVMLHPIKELCITYTLSGIGSGEQTQCHRNYGYEQYQLQEITISLGPVEQTQSNTIVTVGEDIYNINVANNSATKTANPFFNAMANAVADDPQGVSNAFMSAMNFSPNGATRQIANLDCNVYTGPLGSACITDDAILLGQSAAGMELTATSVSFSQGDSSIYDLVNNVTITEGPDLSQGLDGLIQQFSN